MMTLFNFASQKGEPETAPSDNPKRSPKKGRRLWNRDDKSSEVSTSSTQAPSYSPVKVALSEETIHGSETEIGIEISLDWDTLVEKGEEEEEMNVPVLNLADQMRKRKKVHRSQFSVNFPALDREEETKPAEPLRRGHRVPLWETDQEDEYHAVLHLLKSFKVKDEVQAVTDEIGRLNAEIEALAEDQRDLEHPRASHSPKINLTKKVSAWDIHEWLALGESITAEERQQLERRRGLCFSFHLHDKKSREAFMSTCGWNGGGWLGGLSLVQEDPDSGVVSLDPDNCTDGGAGEKIRHVAIVGGRANDTAFFVSRDRDKSSTWGYLPPQLFQRMKRAGFDARYDLMYLATGPQGCYYAEFRSGDCWWGNALKDDKSFHMIVKNWDVYRVAFGPIVTYKDDDGHRWTANSWIILGRDGRAAWKNLPSRLHQKLESRLVDWPAPAEVMLGSDDSYFIRFLDGTIDYCLPAEVASVCDYIESRGGRITDMALHPEVSQDFVIRHTKIRK